MRILIIAEYYWPESVGSGMFITQLAEDLQRRGHQVTMLTAFPNYPDGEVFSDYQGRWFQREQHNGVEIIRTYIYATQRKTFWPRFFSFGSFCASSIPGGLAAAAPDVIYAIIPPLPLGVSAAIAGMAHRAPLVLNIQDMYPDIAVSLGFLRNATAIRFFHGMARWIYRRSAAVSVICDSFKENLIGKGVPAGKIHVIPNWADPDEIRPGAKNNTFRRQVAPNGEFTVIYSGGMGYNTSLGALIDAASLLRDAPVRFVMIGEGVHRQRLEAAVSELGLGNVRFLPFQPSKQYSEVLAASDMQVVALNAESSVMSLPSKVFKIMSAGRPVLALARPESDLAGLVRAASCGICVDPNDGAALAGTLRQLIRDLAGLELMGANARSYLLQHFSREHCVDQIEGVLTQAATGSRGRLRVSPAAEPRA